MRSRELRARALCRGSLVKKTGVLLLPSTIYDAGDAHVRIGFGRATFAQGLERFETFVSAR